MAVPANGKKLSRCYSITSAPETDGHLEFSVKRRGPVSAALHALVRTGDLLPVQPPAGGFVYPAGDRRPLVLLAGGVGCTPLISMLRHGAVRDPARPVTYFHSVRREKDIAFRNDLVLLRQQHRHVKVGVTLTREPGRPGFCAGRIGEAVLRRVAPDPVNTLFYLSVPPGMLEAVRRLLAEMGVPADQVRWEVFSIPAAAPPEPAKHVAAPGPARADDGNDGSILNLGSPAAVLSFSADGPAAACGAETDTEAPETGDAGVTTSGKLLRFRRPDGSPEILRFRRSEILLHWSIAVPFMVCFVTGVVLKFFYNLHSEGISRGILSWIHRISGLGLIAFPALTALRSWRDYRIHLYNVGQAWIWTLDDLKWLFLMGPAALSRKIHLPDQRKFNAAEKLNFMTVMATYPLFAATGVSLLLPGTWFLSWLVHAGLAAVVAPLMFGHIYMALVNPGTRVGLSGMRSGWVDREWARHHYTRWFQDHFEDDGTPKTENE